MSSPCHDYKQWFSILLYSMNFNKPSKRLNWTWEQHKSINDNSREIMPEGNTFHVIELVYTWIPLHWNDFNRFFFFLIFWMHLYRLMMSDTHTCIHANTKNESLRLQSNSLIHWLNRWTTFLHTYDGLCVVNCNENNWKYTVRWSYERFELRVSLQ